MNYRMKFFQLPNASRCALRYPVVAFAFALPALLLSAPARAHTTPGHDSRSVARAPATGLKAPVYQVYNAPKGIVLFRQRAGSTVTVRLEDNEGHLLFREVVSDPEYTRQFDRSGLPDAHYYVRLETAEEHLVKEITVQTQFTRRLVVR
jgi:hypothetical protein